MADNRKIADFIGEKAVYDRQGQFIWGENSKGEWEMLANVRGWGSIQQLFKSASGEVDEDKAMKFQDELGEFIASAINEKLLSLKSNGISET